MSGDCETDGNPVDGDPLTVAVWRGAPEGSVGLRMDPARRVFFSIDHEYADQYGPNVAQWLVSLKRVHVVTQLDSEGDIEIDRQTLLGQGCDGRVVCCDDGSMDVVAFDLGSCSAEGWTGG